MKRVPRLVGAVWVVLVAFGASARAESAIEGTAVDAQTQEPVMDVVVSATSPALEGEQVVVTDSQGRYRIAPLPPGTYTLRFESERIVTYVRSDLPLKPDHTLRVDVKLLLPLEENSITIGCGPPVVDTSSTTTGMRLDPEHGRFLAVNRPGGRNGAVRAAEDLVELVPRAVGGAYGSSIHGASPFENEYLVDGLSTTDASGLNALPLSTEFLQDVSVLTGGYMAEYGGVTGGVVETVTKSGSNEFHGSVFGYWAPGVLEGERPTSSAGSGELKNLGDFGATLGGPLLKDRLWFFAGIAPALGRVARPQPSAPITSRTFFADQRGLQAMAKVTYLPNVFHYMSLALITAPSIHEGTGSDAEPGTLDSTALRTSLDYHGSLLDRRLLLDVSAGWLRQRAAYQPVDGGGADELPRHELGRYQTHATVTYLPQWLGHHFLKAGVDAEWLVQDRTRAGAEGSAHPAVLTSRATRGALGGFVRDQWTFLQRFTLNAGLRYDVQWLDAGDGGQSPVALHQLSPRVGLVVAPWPFNRLTKFFVHYAQYNGRVPVSLMNAYLPSGPDLARAATVAPDLVPTSSSEWSAGAEHELPGRFAVRAHYVHRDLDGTVGLLPDSEGGFVLASPGSGLASDLPRAERTYDAVTLALTRAIEDGWLAEVSYTRSRLFGNHEGPLSPTVEPEEDGLPGAPPLLTSLGGARLLSADRPHVVKVFGAREFSVARQWRVSVGMSYFGASGTRPAGDATSTPWVHTLDTRLAVHHRSRDYDVVSFSLDAFNLLNAQALVRAGEYQTPRQFRLGARYEF